MYLYWNGVGEGRGGGSKQDTMGLRGDGIWNMPWVSYSVAGKMGP